VANQISEVSSNAYAVNTWQRGDAIPSALIDIKIVTVDADGNSDGEVTPRPEREIHVDAKRRSHPLRYERQFSPKASPVTEGLKFMILVVALPMDHHEDLDRSFLHVASFFVIRMFAICKKVHTML